MDKLSLTPPKSVLNIQDRDREEDVVEEGEEEVIVEETGDLEDQVTEEDRPKADHREDSGLEEVMVEEEEEADPMNQEEASIEDPEEEAIDTLDHHQEEGSDQDQEVEEAGVTVVEDPVEGPSDRGLLREDPEGTCLPLLLPLEADTKCWWNTWLQLLLQLDRQ